MKVLEIAYRDNRDDQIHYMLMENCHPDCAKQWLWDILHIKSQDIIYIVEVEADKAIRLPNYLKTD